MLYVCLATFSFIHFPHRAGKAKIDIVFPFSFVLFFAQFIRTCLNNFICNFAYFDMKCKNSANRPTAKRCCVWIKEIPNNSTINTQHSRSHRQQNFPWLFAARNRKEKSNEMRLHMIGIVLFAFTFTPFVFVVVATAV